MSNKNKIPKVPMIMQLEALECGAACLTMILGYYKKWIPLEEVRIACDVTRDGSNAANMIKAGNNYGLISKGYKVGISRLKSDIKFPCIIHWNLDHFVILKGFKKGTAYINDPAEGERQISEDEFNSSFTGIVLTFEPSENFKPEGKPKKFIEYFSKRLLNARSAIVFVLLTTIIMTAINMIKPSFTRVFYDAILSGQRPEWAVTFIYSLAFLAFIEIIITGIQSKYTFRINGKLDITSTSSFMWKLLRMPMRLFSQRMAGDLQSRLDQNATISSQYVHTFAPLIFQAGMSLFYLIVMFRYSTLLTIIGLISVILNLLSVNIVQKKCININRAMSKNTGKLQSYSLNGIEMVETIKASGAEAGYFERWAGYQSNVNNNLTKANRIQTFYGLIPQAISNITSSLILLTGIYLVINNKFTLGAVTSFSAILSSFMIPVNSFATAATTIQDMKISAERVEDVMNNPIDISLEERENPAITSGKLKGRIELKNVSFGYSKLKAPLLNNISLTIEPGEKIAFVGRSGCGKSTIANLIAGLYQPDSGEILYDGEPISQIDRYVFTSSLAVVDQDIILFEDTIKNNICMWDQTIQEDDIIKASQDARIYSDIMERPEGFNYRLNEGGSVFSGGQRQRLEIARSLVLNPSILVLDEATSALDALTEEEVLKAIEARNISCVMIAHRLSTIRDCDCIYVMENGCIIEHGTHEELYSLNGKYAELIRNN